MSTRNRHKHSNDTAALGEVNPDERIYAVGDIHGRHDLFSAAIKLIQSDAATFDDSRRVKLVVLGDFIDRGDDACRVLDALIALSQNNPDVIPILGNHEAALLDFLSDPVHKHEWLKFGAVQTLASYGVAADLRDPGRAQRSEISDALRRKLGDHLDFLEGLGHYTCSGNVLFTHAGVDPAGDPKNPTPDAALWGHPEFLVPQPVAGMRVVHGHYDSAEPVVLPGRICVDTGAYYSGILSCVRLDDETSIMSTNLTQS